MEATSMGVGAGHGQVGDPLRSQGQQTNVLGGVLLLAGQLERQASTVDAVAAAMSPEDLYGGRDRTVWEAMLELRAAGAPIDTISLYEHLRQAGRLGDAGGADYLASLAEACDPSSPTGAPHYAAELHRLAELRRRRDAAAEALAIASDPTSDPEDVERRLVALRRRKPRKPRDQAAPAPATPDADEEAAAEGTLLRDHLPDAPVPELVEVPRGYRVGVDGVFVLRPTRGGLEEVQVALAPVVISGRCEDRLSGDHHLELSWLTDGRWTSRLLSRRDCVDGRSLVAHGGEGLPVTSTRAGGLVDWIAALEVASRPHLPIHRVSSQLGWQGEEEAFLWGRTCIGPPDVDIRHHAEDPGTAALAAGYREEGTWEGWRKAIETIHAYPLVVAGLYASLLAPLLPILQVPNHVWSWDYQTSSGKTILLRLAASVWGDPREDSEAPILLSWDRTQVALERCAAALRGLPLLVDDTKRARDGKTVGSAVYTVCQGQGRGRGTVGGLATTGHWRTVLLSTGEQPLTSHTPDGGTRARVVECWGAPWGAISASSARVVDALSSGVSCHFGHAGPRWVRWLLDHRADWPRWREHLAQTRALYLESTGGGPLARIAGHLAALSVCSYLAHEALDLPWERVDVVRSIWGAVAEEAQEADRADVAYHWACDWVYSHPCDWLGQGDGRQPPRGWAGRLVDGEAQWYPAHLEHLLEDAGFSPAAMLRTWRDRGLLRCDPGKPTTQVRIGGLRVRACCLRLPAQVEDSAAKHYPPATVEAEPQGRLDPWDEGWVGRGGEA